MLLLMPGGAYAVADGASRAVMSVRTTKVAHLHCLFPYGVFGAADASRCAVWRWGGAPAWLRGAIPVHGRRACLHALSDTSEGTSAWRDVQRV